MALANSKYQQKFAAAIVNGIRRYFERTNYSCYGDGTASWTNTDGSSGGDTPITDNSTPAETLDPSEVETTDPWQDIWTEVPAETTVPETDVNVFEMETTINPDDPYYYFYQNLYG